MDPSDLSHTVKGDLEELYRRRLLELKDKFLYSLQNAPLVAYELGLQNIITEEEKQAVLNSPIRRHQKETLFDIVCRKKFANLDRIIRILGATGNDNLSWILNFIKAQILEGFPSDNGTDRTQLSLIVPKDFESPATNTPVYRTRSEQKRQRRGFFAFLGEHDVVLDLQNPNPVLEVQGNSLEKLLYHAAADGDSDIIEELFKLKPDLSPHVIHTWTGRTPLHSAMVGSSSKQALKCVHVLIARFSQQLSENERIDLEEKREAMNLFLNHKDNEGLTALHLAAEEEHLEVIKYLYDCHRCNIFIRSNDGSIPLEAMYIKTPEAVAHFLKTALPSDYIHVGGNCTLEIDFSTVVGMESLEDKLKIPETEMLAKMVFQDNDNSSKTILSHVIVKTFLELKWQKMKAWLYGWIFLQVICVFLYTLTLIQIFIIDCPYTKDAKVRESSVHTGTLRIAERTIGTYLVGDMIEMTFSEFFEALFHVTDPSSCRTKINKSALIGSFLALGCFIITKEFGEWAIINKLFFTGRRKRYSVWKNMCDGFRFYSLKLENIFQLLFLGFLMIESSLAFDYFSELHYSAAALSVVVGWSLVLMNFGKIYGLGAYIQILGKVIKIFLKIVGMYFILIVAFSVAFSILIPEMSQFHSFPQSFSKSIIMMTGELDYGTIFYPWNTTAPVTTVPVTAHIMYTGFVLLICVILINLLVGLTVHDIEGLKGKSEVILRSVQVEKLYVMESTLFRLNGLYQKIKRAFMRIFRRSKYQLSTSQAMCFDLFVINPTEEEAMAMINGSHSLHGMVAIKSLKEIPKKLQKQLRVLAEDPDFYTKSYLKK